MNNVLYFSAPTVEPLNEGHFGTNSFVLNRDVVLFRSYKMYCTMGLFGDTNHVLFREVVLYSECPL